MLTDTQIQLSRVRTEVDFELAHKLGEACHAISCELTHRHSMVFPCFWDASNSDVTIPNSLNFEDFPPFVNTLEF